MIPCQTNEIKDSYLEDAEVIELLQFIWNHRKRQKLQVWAAEEKQSLHDLVKEVRGFLNDLCEHEIDDLATLELAKKRVWQRTVARIDDAFRGAWFFSKAKEKLIGAFSPRVWLYSLGRETIDEILLVTQGPQQRPGFFGELTEESAPTSGLLPIEDERQRTARGELARNHCQKASPKRDGSIGGQCRRNCDLLFMVRNGMDFKQGQIGQFTEIASRSLTRYVQKCHTQMRELVSKLGRDATSPPH